MKAAPLMARALKSTIKGVLPDWIILIRTHRRIHGAFPSIVWPKTFNEKVLHRMLFDRRPLLTEMADKEAARRYVELRLGPQILPKRCYLTTRPETILFDDLPERFVVKPTHGSGWVYLVPDKSKLNRDALIAMCMSWMSQSFYKLTREWAYRNIKPQIIVEEFIDDGSGGVPRDYKLFCFNGHVELIQVDEGRFADHRRRLYSPTWERLGALLAHDDITGDVPRPAHLAEMIAAAETLGSGIDFVRVDLYDTPERIYFGELTMTPGAGRERFTPREFDRYLGDRWKLP